MAVMEITEETRRYLAEIGRKGGKKKVKKGFAAISKERLREIIEARRKKAEKKSEKGVDNVSR